MLCQRVGIWCITIWKVPSWICSAQSWGTSMTFQNVAKLLKAIMSIVMSACLRPSEWNHSAPTGRIFMKFDIGTFFKKIYGENSFGYNRIRIRDMLHENLCTFICRSFLLRMRNVSGRSCKKKIKTYFMFSSFFFFFIRALYGIMWKNVVE